MKFDYGKNGLEISLDPSWNVNILQPTFQSVIENPVYEIKKAINNPISCPSLKSIIRKTQKLNQICLVVSDATRPVPSHLILEALIEELNSYGITDKKIVVLIATGLHRPSHEEELSRIVGNKLIERLKVINHVATDKKSLKYLGKSTDDIPIYINKAFYESDLKILTGYVEPHFFFGFSGGRKALIPGIAGAETIQFNHSAENISSPYSRFGIFKKNPMHKNATEVTKLIGVDFIINVCIDEKHRITQIAAGDVEKAHEKLVDYQLKKVFKKVSEPYDIVVCGNGGYPLDLNLYQAVKSMAIGEMAVKRGGTIISVNECSDGIGEGQDKFRDLLFSNNKPIDIYNKILNKEILVPDQWEIQILARVLIKAEIFVVSNLKANELGNIGLKYAKNVEEAINLSIEKHGKDSNILFLPNGPQVLPLL
ncbi:MAG: nickel-dependent lactate racemase [Promethearchaeota archaeon]